ncbi:hypothetical protein [Desulfosediminicola sp.]|uniref:hypothetical protein n=1 Tax=Desulfosediminicola sp. TaxID=2886825 RepID=UPI003AF2BC6A
MKEKRNDEKKQWEKPVVKDVRLEFDKDVVASCHTASGGKAAIDTGCLEGPNVRCN